MVCGVVVSLLVVGVAAYLRSSSASSASLRLPGSAARRKGETPQVNSNGHYHHGNHRPIIHFFFKKAGSRKISLKTFMNLINTLIKKKTKFPSYIRKFRWDRVQSHI
jgi:hypothetical protein